MLKPVFGFPNFLPVLGITTNLKLLKQQDLCDKPLPKVGASRRSGKKSVKTYALQANIHAASRAYVFARRCA
jgi:hypothetical protein